MITVKEYNFDTNEVDVKAVVSSRTLARSMDINQLADVLEEWVNFYGGNAFGNGEKMGRLFQESHHTLQGLLTNLALGILSGLGETEYSSTDAGNYQAILACNKIKEMLDSGELNWSPFI